MIRVQADCPRCGKQIRIDYEHRVDDCLAYLAKRVSRLERVIVVAEGAIKSCAFCRRTMFDRRKQAIYCSQSCRQQAYERRRTGGRLCGWAPCGRSLAGKHKNVKYCSQTCKAKEAHYAGRVRDLGLSSTLFAKGSSHAPSGHIL